MIQIITVLKGNDILLNNCVLFKGLEPTYIQQLLDCVQSTTKIYGCGELIWTPFESNSKIGIILKGKVTVYANLYCGNEIIINQLCNNDIIGLSCPWSGNKVFPAFIKTNCECTILFLTQQSLLKLFELDCTIFNNFMVYISNRLRYLISKIELLAISNTKERLLCFICQQIKHQEDRVKLNKSKLINQLSISHASLYRALNQLENEQYIKKHSDGSISLKLDLNNR